jgi:hypothetical protein
VALPHVVFRNSKGLGFRVNPSPLTPLGYKAQSHELCIPPLPACVMPVHVSGMFNLHVKHNQLLGLQHARNVLLALQHASSLYRNHPLVWKKGRATITNELPQTHSNLSSVWTERSGWWFPRGRWCMCSQQHSRGCRHQWGRGSLRGWCHWQ